MGRWSSGEVEQWGGGAVGRWSSGEVEQWGGGAVGEVHVNERDKSKIGLVFSCLIQ